MSEQQSASGGLSDADFDRLWHDAEPAESPEAVPADAAPAEAVAAAASPDAQPTDTAAAPATPDTAAPEALAEPQSPDPAPSAAPAPDATPPASPVVEEPFGFAADGQRFEIPGAVKRGDRIELTAEAWARHVQPHLADRRQWQAKEQQYRTQLREVQDQKSTEKLTTDAVMQQIHGLMALPDEEAFERFYAMKQQFPLLVRDAQIKALQQQTTRYTAADEQQRTAQLAQELEPTLQHGLRGYIAHFAGQEPYRDLGLSTDKFYDLLWGNLDKVFYQTGETDPESGYPKFGVHFDYIQRVIDTEAKYRRAEVTKQRELAQQQQAFAEAAKKNAAAQAAKQAPTQAPPAAPGRTRPAPSAKAPESTKNWRDRLEDIEL